jgi:hypothetical protein
MVTLQNFVLCELQFFGGGGDRPRNSFQFRNQDSTTYHTGNFCYLYSFVTVLSKDTRIFLDSNNMRCSKKEASIWFKNSSCVRNGFRNETLTNFVM